MRHSTHNRVLKTGNANMISREFKKLSNIKAIATNIALMIEKVNGTLKFIKKNKEFELGLKKPFGVNYVKIHYGSGESYLTTDIKIISKYLDFLKIIQKNEKIEKNEMQRQHWANILPLSLKH